MSQLVATISPGLQAFFWALWPFNLVARERLYLVLLCALYVAGAQIGTYFFTSPAVLSPAPAVALAGLFLGGLRMWPAIYVGAIIQGLLLGSHVTFLILYPLAQTFQALLGAALLQYLNFDPVFRRLRDMLIIMGVAASVSVIVPTVAFLILYLMAQAGTPSTAVITWGSWWTGYFLSLLVITPLILRWFAKPRFKRTRLQVLEIVLVFAALGVVMYVLFWTPYTSIRGVSVVYMLLIPMFWIAIRFGPRFTFVSIVMLLVSGVGAALYGPTAPPAEELGQRLFQFEVFTIIMAAIFYIVTALQEERRVAVFELRQYIDRLETALNRLSMQDRAKSDFVAVLAHELRNPLAPLVSSLELLRLKIPQDPQHDQVIELMDNRLKTIQRLLDDLLDVSRLSRAKLQLKKEHVALRPIIERSIQATDHYRAARNQTLTIDIADEGLVLDADPVRIEQILSNLLSNASKFTPNGGHITITKRREGDKAFISVKDDGIGIDPEKIEKIFEPFTQLGANSGEGLGIGLSLTQVLTEMHGGSVEVKSEGEGKGSEFIVRLPVMNLRSSSLAAQPGRKGTVALPNSVEAKKKVLVVDDNEAAAHGIGKLLEHKGYVVDFAYSGEEARKKTAEFAPQAVVLDIGLPDIDGYEVAKHLRNNDGFVGQLVALTGYGQEEDRSRAYEAGFNHHLTKPISISDLDALLATT